MSQLTQLFQYATSGPFVFIGCAVLVVLVPLGVARIVQAIRG